MLEEKNVRPFGHVKKLACCSSHTPSMFPSVQFMTAIWTKQAQIVAATWQEKVIRGGT